MHYHFRIALLIAHNIQKAMESRSVGLEKVKEDVIGKAIEYLTTEQIRDLYQK